MMRKSDLFLLVASTFALSGAYADGVLKGLEMDVMDAGESPTQATARIALPGAGAVVDEDRNGELITGQARNGGHAGEAAALDTAGPAGPASPAEPVSEAGPETTDSIDLGAPDVSDGGGDVGSGGVGAEPIDPGVVDGGPGTIGIIEPGDGSIDDTPINEPPVDGPPPVDEIPIGELPGDGTVVDQPPTDDTPVDDVVDGDPTGGGVTIMPEPGEAPGDVQPAVESGGPSSGDNR